MVGFGARQTFEVRQMWSQANARGGISYQPNEFAGAEICKAATSSDVGWEG
jgi:hypothetical protein